MRVLLKQLHIYLQDRIWVCPIYAAMLLDKKLTSEDQTIIVEIISGDRTLDDIVEEFYLHRRTPNTPSKE